MQILQQQQESNNAKKRIHTSEINENKIIEKDFKSSKSLNESFRIVQSRFLKMKNAKKIHHKSEQ